MCGALIVLAGLVPALARLVDAIPPHVAGAMLAGVAAAAVPRAGTGAGRGAAAGRAGGGRVVLVLIEAVAGLALLGALAASLASAVGEPAGREAAAVTFVVMAAGVAFLGLGSAFLTATPLGPALPRRGSRG